MVRVRTSPVDTPEAQELLREYFALRASLFPGGAYRTVFPDPDAFVPPAGAFVVVEAEDADGLGVVGPVGCGGIRRIADGPRGVRYEVKHVFLTDATRGHGWGRLLLEDLERRAVGFGADELVLDTHHTLEAAGGLYATSGFAQIEPYNDNANATRWYGKAVRA